MYDSQPPDASYLDAHTVIAAMVALNSGRAAAVTSPDVRDRRKFVQRMDRLQISLFYVAIRRWDELHANASASGLAWPWPASQRAAYTQLRSVFYLNGWENYTLRYGFDINASLPPVGPECNVDCFGMKLGVLPAKPQRVTLKADEAAVAPPAVVTLNASAPESSAARRLQSYLARITRGPVRLHVSAGDNFQGVQIAVGYHAAVAAGLDAAALRELGADGYALRSAGLRVPGSAVISGGHRLAMGRKVILIRPPYPLYSYSDYQYKNTKAYENDLTAHG
jgi:hypothetical protein